MGVHVIRHLNNQPTPKMKHITIYHVLSAKTGEQLFEQRTVDRSTDDARGRALEWAAAHIDEGQPVTIWKTSQINEENATVEARAK